jgi:cytochrome c556
MRHELVVLCLLFTVASALAADPTPPNPVSAREAQARAATMDSRTPVPLVPMMAHHQKEQMRGHLESVQGVVEALARSDFAAAEKAARSMGFSEQMGMMCQHMGAGAPGFSEQALKFHHAADRMADAAHRKDRAATLKRLQETLQTCTACHATYRQQVVDQATYDAAATASSKATPH